MPGVPDLPPETFLFFRHNIARLISWFKLSSGALATFIGDGVTSLLTTEHPAGKSVHDFRLTRHRALLRFFIPERWVSYKVGIRGLVSHNVQLRRAVYSTERRFSDAFFIADDWGVISVVCFAIIAQVVHFSRSKAIASSQWSFSRVLSANTFVVVFRFQVYPLWYSTFLFQEHLFRNTTHTFRIPTSSVPCSSEAPKQEPCSFDDGWLSKGKQN